MSDVRGYSGIAERVDPTVLAGDAQHAPRRDEQRRSSPTGGTVMQYVGDAVMAVFGAPFPQPDHADRALRGRVRDARTPGRGERRSGAADGLPEFGLGIGLSTGEVAAALLGSDERLEYTLVGDTVNLAQRLQDLARPPGTVLSGATVDALTDAAARSTPLDASSS